MAVQVNNIKSCVEIMNSRLYAWPSNNQANFKLDIVQQGENANMRRLQLQLDDKRGHECCINDSWRFLGATKANGRPLTGVCGW